MNLQYEIASTNNKQRDCINATIKIICWNKVDYFLAPEFTPCLSRRFRLSCSRRARRFLLSCFLVWPTEAHTPTHHTENAHTHTEHTHTHRTHTHRHTENTQILTHTHQHRTAPDPQNHTKHIHTPSDNDWSMSGNDWSSHRDLARLSRLLSSLLSRVVNLLSLPNNMFRWLRVASRLKRNCQPGVNLRDLSFRWLSLLGNNLDVETALQLMLWIRMPDFTHQMHSKAKADSTLRSSQAVPHPSTSRALSRLTSEVERDPVHSTRYGRQRNLYAYMLRLWKCGHTQTCTHTQNRREHKHTHETTHENSNTHIKHLHHQCDHPTHTHTHTHNTHTHTHTLTKHEHTHTHTHTHTQNTNTHTHTHTHTHPHSKYKHVLAWEGEKQENV